MESMISYKLICCTYYIPDIPSQLSHKQWLTRWYDLHFSGNKIAVLCGRPVQDLHSLRRHWPQTDTSHSMEMPDVPQIDNHSQTTDDVWFNHCSTLWRSSAVNTDTSATVFLSGRLLVYSSNSYFPPLVRTPIPFTPQSYPAELNKSFCFNSTGVHVRV